MNTISPLAKTIPKMRRSLSVDGTTNFFRKSVPWHGVCLHTTGSGVPEKAYKLNKPPIDVAIQVYSDLEMSCPHYVVDGNGTIAQITDESLVAPHCGIKAWQRQDMLDGTWVNHVGKVGLALWQKRWAGVKSPQHLFPGKSSNSAYIGIEMIPMLTPESNGHRFTNLQYDAVSALLRDISSRNKIKLSGNRLVGHEDLQPYERWTKSGGWDVGALRVNPYFFWDRIKI